MKTYLVLYYINDIEEYCVVKEESYADALFYGISKCAEILDNMGFIDLSKAYTKACVREMVDNCDECLWSCDVFEIDEENIYSVIKELCIDKETAIKIINEYKEMI